MSMTGDFDKFRRLRNRLMKAGSPLNRLALSRVMGETARSQLMKGFRNSLDPYGSLWAELKSRRGKPLLDTGRLRNSFVSNPTENGFTLWTQTKYAKFHQYGTGGRKRASTRFQAIGKKGRFTSRIKAGKRKRGSTSVRALNFKVGSGKIPARMMVPTESGGLGTWEAPLRSAAHRFLSKTLRGK